MIKRSDNQEQLKITKVTTTGDYLAVDPQLHHYLLAPVIGSLQRSVIPLKCHLNSHTSISPHSLIQPHEIVSIHNI